MQFETRFQRRSLAERQVGLYLVFLAAAISERRRAAPEFFAGEVARPLEFRDELQFLSDVVGARFHRPDLWRYLDPVMTSGERVVRLECFSSCASVYARVDLTPSAFADAEYRRHGTTNVDLGTEFTRELASLRAGKKARLEIGEDSIRLATDTATAVEHRVELPQRWVRGFLQIQAIQRRTEPRFELARAAARQLVHAIPASATGTLSILPRQGRPQVLQRRAPAGSDAIELSGGHRLRLLQRVLAHAQRLRVYEAEEGGSSVWVIDTGAARCTLALSGSVDRGFSGEGDALRRLSSDDDAEDDALAAARVAVEGLVGFTPADLARLLGQSEGECLQTIDRLSIQGHLGYDRDADRYFHRRLPFVAGRKTRARVAGSKEILERDGVEVETREVRAEGVRASGWAEGNDGTYHVAIEVDRGGYLSRGECTCRWIQSHGLSRGPCRHLLALRFLVEGDRR